MGHLQNYFDGTLPHLPLIKTMTLQGGSKVVNHADNAMLNAYTPMSDHSLHQRNVYDQLFAVSFNSTYDSLNDDNRH